MIVKNEKGQFMVLNTNSASAGSQSGSGTMTTTISSPAPNKPQTTPAIVRVSTSATTHQIWGPGAENLLGITN